MQQGVGLFTPEARGPSGSRSGDPFVRRASMYTCGHALRPWCCGPQRTCLRPGRPLGHKSGRPSCGAPRRPSFGCPWHWSFDARVWTLFMQRAWMYSMRALLTPTGLQVWQASRSRPRRLCYGHFRGCLGARGASSRWHYWAQDTPFRWGVLMQRVSTLRVLDVHCAGVRDVLGAIGLDAYHAEHLDAHRSDARDAHRAGAPDFHWEARLSPLHGV